MNIIIFLVVGGISGWLAGVIMKGSGYGVIIDIVLGIIGGIVGGHVLGVLGITAGGLIGTIITCVLGAVIIIAILRLIKKA